MSKIWIHDISKDDLDEYKIRYLANISPSQHLLEALEYSYNELWNCLCLVDENKSKLAYQKGKWSIKTLAIHLNDSERVFQYRALCLSRDPSMMLTPFEENKFADNSNAEDRLFVDILEEMKLVHSCGFALFKSFNFNQITCMGHFNGQRVNAALFGFLIAGHRLHHLEILRTRYLI